MLPPLSDRTKSFAAVTAVLAVALCNVVFGTEWVSGPPPPYRAPVARVSGETAAVPVPPAQLASPSSRPANANAAAPPAKASVPMSEPIAPQPLAPAPAAAAAPACDVAACAAAYRSFRESDCTWQPFDGPRRLCDKGAETSAEPPVDARAADAAGFARCNRRACGEAYSSFNPSDCTYQPLDGPRRLCTK